MRLPLIDGYQNPIVWFEMDEAEIAAAHEAGRLAMKEFIESGQLDLKVAKERRQLDYTLAFLSEQAVRKMLRLAPLTPEEYVRNKFLPDGFYNGLSFDVKNIPKIFPLDRMHLIISGKIHYQVYFMTHCSETRMQEVAVLGWAPAELINKQKIFVDLGRSGADWKNHPKMPIKFLLPNKDFFHYAAERGRS